MKERGDVSLNLNLLNEKSTFEKFEEALKVSIFGVLFVLLKNQDYNQWLEIIFVLIQLLQLLAFPFTPTFVNIWKTDSSYSNVAYFLQYFQVIAFFNDKTQIYLIVFYICVCIVILVIINIIYVAISFSKNRLNVVWPLKILKAGLYYLATIFFLPILEFLVSIFVCESSSITSSGSAGNSTNTTTIIQVNFYYNALTCWQGTHFIHIALSLIAIISLLLICVIVQTTFYETKTNTMNQSAKSNSKSDVFMLVTKVVAVLLFSFLTDLSGQWILVIVIFFLSGFLFYSYYEGRPYYNDTIMKVYLVSTGIFFWSCFVLLLGKILETTAYNGSLALFFIGIPIVGVVIITNFENKLAVLLTNLNKFQKGDKVLNQIQYFLDIAEKKDTDRNAKILLKGYIFLYEESCVSEDCALKKYLANLENDVDSVIFLHQHAEVLYQNAISKFPNCTSLRISYAFFLLEKMNKKSQANLELLNTEKYNPRFDEQFIIYRYKKLIEEQSNDISENEDNMDIVSNIAYKNHSNQFKNCIGKASTLYMDFWSLLLNPNQDTGDDLAKLNDYGSKINVLVEEINTHFEKMQKIKQNDQEVIRYYSDFLNDILNDKEKANQYKSRLNEIDGTKQNYDDVNLFNMDFNALASSDEYQYIIISAQQEKFMVITNVSLGICTMFGYTRQELIGKNIEILLPEIYHKSHRLILQNKLNDHKKSSVNVQNTRNYKPSFKEIKAFGKNKSRYLIPFTFKVTLVPSNEQNDTVFLAKISQDLFNIGSTQNQQTCHILTNNFFIIQNFTANALNILGMNSNAINNGNMEVVKFIKEFNEELIKYNIEEEKTPEEIMAIKRKIISTKFKKPTPILWKKSDGDQTNKFRTTNMDIQNSLVESKPDYKLSKSDSKNSRADNKFVTSFMVNEVELMLTISEITMNKKQEGYSFKFEVIKKETVETLEEMNSYFKTEMQNINIGKELDKQLKEAASSTIGKNTPFVTETPNLKEASDSDIKLDKYFVPDTENYFMLDPQKMSYLVNPKNQNEVKDAIRQEAIKKINLESSLINVSKEESYTESENSGDFESGSEYQDSALTQSLNVMTDRQKKSLEYYPVEFSNFKLLTYDYKHNAIKEVSDWVKESQVEYKRNEDDRKKSSESINKIDKNKTTKDQTEQVEEEEVKDSLGKENILIKQIEYALNKEETQPTIVTMKWMSFFIFLVFIGLGAIFMIFFLNSIIDLNAHIVIIYNAYGLIQNTVYGIFHTRELILLNNQNYTNIYQDSTDYILNNTNTILSLFQNSHDTLTNIITTSLTFTAANTIRLNNYTILTSILQDDFTFKSFNLTLSSEFIEANTAFYHIAHMTIDQIYPTIKDVYFYMYNSLNNIYQELYVDGDIYIQELGLSIGSYQNLFLYIFISIAVMCVIAYFLLIYAYLEVGRRKESYLEVFFEIGGNVIKNSLEKCEKFTKKIQSDSINDHISNFDESEMIEDTIIQPLNSNSKKNTGHKRKNNNSKEVRSIKWKLAVSLFLLGIFFFLIYFIFKSYLDQMISYIDIYQNICLEQAQYLMIFNTLREYFFDLNSSVNATVISTYLDSQLDNIYMYKLQRDEVASNYQSSFPTDYANIYTQIINQNICPYSTDFFTTYINTNLTCQNFVSNSTSYGLNILLTNYVEEIRYVKYKFDLMMEQLTAEGYLYNNTLYLTPEDPLSQPNVTSDYVNNNPFNIFNDNAHRDLLIVNRYLLRPAYLALTTQMKTSINNSIATFETIYIVLLSMFFVSIVGMYFLVWRPFENGLNQTIYKTKNMLSIIPKEVLASLSNIHKLLDLGQSLKAAKRISKK